MSDTLAAIDQTRRAEPMEFIGLDATVGDFLALLKPRVMSLVVFTGLVGLVSAPVPIHPFIGMITILCIAVGAGASGALNMWYDADIDGRMRRTATRPIPRGRISREQALAFGTILSLGSVSIMGLAVSLLAAGLLAFTIGFYVFIYTMWLKRRTSQNIVIGGVAGALPPVIGWAAAAGSIDLGAILLFLIIFLWTPPHFWALALVRSDDYAAVNVPMLPVVAGKRETRRQILLYALLLVPVTLSPAFIGLAGLFYGVIAGILSAVFVALAIRVWHAGRTVATDSPQANEPEAKQLFAYSIFYLFGLFSALLAEKTLGII